MRLTSTSVDPLELEVENSLFDYVVAFCGAVCLIMFGFGAAQGGVVTIGSPKRKRSPNDPTVTGPKVRILGFLTAIFGIALLAAAGYRIWSFV